MRLDEKYEHIRNYFYREFPESYVLVKNLNIYISKDIYSLVNDRLKEEDFNDVVDGKCDNLIRDELNNYINRIFTQNERKDCNNLYNKICKVLEKERINFNSDTFDHMIKLTLVDMWGYFNGRIDDVTDKDILKSFDRVRNDLVKKIYKNINYYLNGNIVYVTNLGKKKISVEDFRRGVIQELFLKEDRQFLNNVSRIDLMLNNRYEDMGSLKETYYSSMNKLNDYIRRFIKEIPNKDVPNVAVNLSAKGINDNHSRVNINRERMKKSSVLVEDKPKEIPVNGGKNKIPKRAAKILIIATLVGVLAVGGIHIYKTVSDNKAIDIIRTAYGEIDKYNYTNEDASDRIINFYIRFSNDDFNNINYSTLGFYEEYNYLYNRFNNRDDVLLYSLKQMDAVFDTVKDDVINKSDDYELGELVRANDDKYFFLDFVYDRLASTGYDKVETDEYQKALLYYKYANYGNRYGVAGAGLTSGQVETIEDVMDKYMELCSQYELDLGYSLKEDNKGGKIL